MMEICKSYDFIIPPDHERETVWTQYQAVWRLAQETCPVSYSSCLPPGVGGGYSTRDDYILIGSGSNPEGETHPQMAPTSVLKQEASILVHELSHAYSKRESGEEFKEYLRALSLWNFVNMDGTILREDERKLIFDEETRVEHRGLKMVQEFAPSIAKRYSSMMIGNLTAYSSLLWEGRWPDGTRQAWQGTSPFLEIRGPR